MTSVEHESQWWPRGQGGSLGTIRYSPSKEEQPFFDRLPSDEVVTGSHIDGYDIATRDKKYVGWFGIVREIDEDGVANRTVLTVEHKYFDGLTDAHLQAVSFNGSGDFRATLTGTGHRIPPLSLVKVYGTVVKGKEGTLPRIDAVFVRNWHWGTFTFLDAYGTQRGSEKWRKANRIPLDPKRYGALIISRMMSYPFSVLPLKMVTKTNDTRLPSNSRKWAPGRYRPSLR